MPYPKTHSRFTISQFHNFTISRFVPRTTASRNVTFKMIVSQFIHDLIMLDHPPPRNHGSRITQPRAPSISAVSPGRSSFSFKLTLVISPPSTLWNVSSRIVSYRIVSSAQAPIHSSACRPKARTRNHSRSRLSRSLNLPTRHLPRTSSRPKRTSRLQHLTNRPHHHSCESLHLLAQQHPNKIRSMQTEKISMWTMNDGMVFGARRKRR